MRDPGRIIEVLNELELYWYDHPDLRLGQIIGNIAADSDPYFIEDTVLLDALRNLNQD